jgi:cytochrome b6-f complex iron-sulfur subunit
MNRRRFLSFLWIGLGLAALAEFVWMGVLFVTSRKRRASAGDTDALVVAGAVEDFEPSSVTPFPGGKFYLARRDDGGFLALSRVCTHLGCSVPWMEEEKRFVCPCHSAAFDLNGSVLNPPAPRALNLHPVTFEDGLVKVDTGRTQRRDDFRISQVAYP